MKINKCYAIFMVVIMVLLTIMPAVSGPITRQQIEPGFRIPPSNLKIIPNPTDSYTKLLMHFSGADNGTTMRDSSANAMGNASRGDAPVTDTAQYKFDLTSLYMDGSNDYIYYATDSDFVFATSTFCVDFWVRFTTLPVNGSYEGLFSYIKDSAQNYSFHLYNNGGTYQWLFYNETGAATYNIDLTENSPGLWVNTWYHIAIVRNGNDWSIYQDGTQCGTSDTDTDTVGGFSGSPVFNIGRSYNKANSLIYTEGYIDEFRISVGAARYTTGFSAPTSAYECADTSVSVTANSINMWNSTTKRAKEWYDVSSTVHLSDSGAGGKQSDLSYPNLTNTWWYIYAISNGSTNAIFASTSASPTLPDGYTYSKWIGCFWERYTSSTVLSTLLYQYNGTIYMDQGVAFLSSGALTTWSEVSYAAFVPTGASEVLIFAHASVSGASYASINACYYRPHGYSAGAIYAISFYYAPSYADYICDTNTAWLPVVGTSYSIDYYVSHSPAVLSLVVSAFKIPL